jgi:hypothetical protein
VTVVMILDFGKNEEGVRTYRVNATDKGDLEKIIDESKGMGWKFWTEPYPEKSHKSWSVLLKMYDPKELNYPEESM